MNLPKRKYVIIVTAIFALLAILLIQLLSRSRETQKSGVLPKVDLSKPSTWARAFKPLPVSYKKLQAIVKTPIEFYGRVEDQHGNAIANADVSLYVHASMFGEPAGEKRHLKSGSDGTFSIKGVRGSALGVHVLKEGYLPLPNTPGRDNVPFSRGSFDIGLEPSKGAAYKDPKNPVIFTLIDVGEVEPLVYVRWTRWKLQVDGTPRRIALDAPNGVGKHQIEFSLISKRKELPKGSSVYTAFNWTFVARLPGGGFAPCESDYAFEAPEGGYQESIEIDYRGDMTREEWKRAGAGRYFVRFPDGTHGKIKFAVDSGTDADYGPLSLEWWFNPKPGSRNLASLQYDQIWME